MVISNNINDIKVLLSNIKTHLKLIQERESKFSEKKLVQQDEEYQQLLAVLTEYDRVIVDVMAKDHRQISDEQQVKLLTMMTELQETLLEESKLFQEDFRAQVLAKSQAISELLSNIALKKDKFSVEKPLETLGNEKKTNLNDKYSLLINIFNKDFDEVEVNEIINNFAEECEENHVEDLDDTSGEFLKENSSEEDDFCPISTPFAATEDRIVKKSESSLSAQKETDSKRPSKTINLDIFELLSFYFTSKDIEMAQKEKEHFCYNIQSIKKSAKDKGMECNVIFSFPASSRSKNNILATHLRDFYYRKGEMMCVKLSTSQIMTKVPSVKG